MAQRKLFSIRRCRRPALASQHLAEQHAELSQRYARLCAAEAAREQMVNSLVHDIRSPLMATHAGLEVIQRAFAGQELPPFVAEALASSLRSLHTVVDLTNDLLDIKRIQSGYQDLPWQKIQLEQLLGATCDLMLPLAREREIVLKYQVASLELQVCGEPRLLQRTLVNLLSNAIRYTPLGGRVLLTAQPAAGGVIRLTVDDTGPGVQPDDRERIFQPFARGNDQSYPVGNGLGLAFCWEVALLHGGQIWADEAPGGGGRFCLELPLISNYE